MDLMLVLWTLAVVFGGFLVSAYAIYAVRKQSQQLEELSRLILASHRFNPYANPRPVKKEDQPREEMSWDKVADAEGQRTY